MNWWADEYLIKANIDPSDVIDTINKVLKKPISQNEKSEPIELKSGLNIFKIKNPVNGDYIEVSVNVKV
jgi:hypothetical protein